MTLYIVSKLPISEQGYYCHYGQQRLGRAGWVYCDIIPYVRRRQESWFDQLGEWHTAFSKVADKATAWWWLSPLSRLIAFQPSLFYDLWYALGIAECYRTMGGRNLYLVGFSSRLVDYLQEFLPNVDIHVEPVAVRSRGLFSRLREQWCMVCRCAALLIQGIRNSLRRSRKNRAQALVFSYYLDKTSFLPGENHFFHGLFDTFSGLELPQLCWLCLERIDSVKDALSMARAATEKGGLCVTVWGTITVGDLLRIAWRVLHFRIVLAMCHNRLPVLTIDDYHSRTFTARYYQAVKKELPVAEFATYYAAKRILKDAQIASILYPYEGKGVERALIKARNEMIPEAVCIAYAHAIYNPGLLYVRFHHEELLGSLKPDVIACTGPRMVQWFTTWGRMSPERVVEVGSSRYGYKLSVARQMQTRIARLKVLVLAGLGHELSNLAEWVAQDPMLFDGCELTVRKYPFSWIREQDDAIARMRSFYPQTMENNLSLQEQLETCDVALTSATSAGIEAMLSRRPIIYVDLHSMIDLNPIAHKGNLSRLSYCTQPHELKEALRLFTGMPDTEYNQYIEAQYQFARELFSMPKPGYLLSLLKGEA